MSPRCLTRWIANLIGQSSTGDQAFWGLASIVLRLFLHTACLPSRPRSTASSSNSNLHHRQGKGHLHQAPLRGRRLGFHHQVLRGMAARAGALAAGLADLGRWRLLCPRGRTIVLGRPCARRAVSLCVCRVCLLFQCFCFVVSLLWRSSRAMGFVCDSQQNKKRPGFGSIRH